ncbi:hypothetical protein QGM71_01215 [Virgibacillus sp. C22-A2]|uniref:Uncharacterized protein n=1 Tax=Virgibacillus tibetensis TaxID=3042313 RepID=A0ABU6KAN3_9BACI|nr:hypothetical protein [Virgibacillus sp. C22-A2]
MKPMKIKVMSTTQNWTTNIDENHRVDTTLYENKFTNTVTMSAWKEGRAVALGCAETSFFMWSKLLANKMSRSIYLKRLKKVQNELNADIEDKGHKLNVNILEQR